MVIYDEFRGNKLTFQKIFIYYFNGIKNKMAKPQQKLERRLELIAAAQTMILRHGLPSLTLRSVANEAGMTSSAALYYFPGLKDLLVEVQDLAIQRFCVRRGNQTHSVPDIKQRLLQLIDGGLPSGPEDQLCRLLVELGVYARTDAAYAARHISLFERQVAIYVGVLEAGAATGIFTLSQPSNVVARALVLLEDGVGLHLVNLVPAISRVEAVDIMVSYAQAATGCRLRD